jgi:Ser/Thr protein kinase RdoA (MazF antagonist)
MNFADALSGRAKAEGIQWLLLSAVPRRALRDQLKALLSAKTVLGTCRLRRARFKPGRKLRAYYDALIHIEGSEGYRARPVAVTWSLDGGEDWGAGEDGLPELQAEALRRGVAAPFRQLTAELPEWSMHIQVSPLDTRFPQLVRLSDPRYVGDMLAAASAAADVSQDSPRPDGYAVTPLRYHPGQRHILRYDPLGATDGGLVVAKLYIGEDGARAFRVARHAADWLAKHGEDVTTVRPLAYVADDRVVLYPRVPGVPLSELLRRPSRGVARCLAHAGAALHALHQLPRATVGPLPAHDFASEVSEIAQEACDHIPALLPSVGAAMDALLDRARELHPQLPQEPPTFTHGDFKCEHVWAAPGGSTLIDFDNSCVADPAFDIGKFLADLQLWNVIYDLPGLDRAQERFLFAYSAGAPSERLVRALLYEAIQLVKVARRVPFDRDWAPRTKELIRRAQAVINDLDLTVGSPTTQPSLPGFLAEFQPRHLIHFEGRPRPLVKGARG